MTASSAERLAAALADRYRIERELGAGGMATVYLAHDVRHDRRVALKVLRPELGAIIGAERFLAEIRTTANLQHPHILPLFDSGQVDGTVFYVMPYVDGESLRDRVAREKQLPIDDALRIAREVGDALQYAHGNGVIHRDIKPENIMLQRGHALVADFGIALAAAKTGGTRMTETGMSLGTPRYMSPEQAMGERDLDARSDIYALGCVVYEMLTGDAPFTGPTAQAIVAKVLTDEPRPPVELRKTVPDHVSDAVLVALAKLPADRFSSAAEFMAAMQGTLAVSRSRPAGSRAPGRNTSRRNPLLLAGAVIVASLAGWSGHALLRSQAPDVVRLSIPVPEGITTARIEQPNVALSRDGRTVAYISDDLLRIRRLDAAESIVIRGSNGASVPFFSADGTKVGFGMNGQLYWSAVDGGTPTAISGTQIGFLAGASWDENNRIVYEEGSGIAGLLRIPASGGKAERITTVEKA